MRAMSSNGSENIVRDGTGEARDGTGETAEGLISVGN